MFEEFNAVMAKNITKLSLLSKELNPSTYDGQPYLTWRDTDGTVHVQVEQLMGESVVWDISEGKMEKVFDLKDMPF